LIANPLMAPVSSLLADR